MHPELQTGLQVHVVYDKCGTFLCRPYFFSDVTELLLR
jgi:hypothetical protein